MRPPEDRPLYPRYLKLNRGADLFQNHVDVNFIIFLEAFEVTRCFFKNKITKRFVGPAYQLLCGRLDIKFDLCGYRIGCIDN